MFYIPLARSSLEKTSNLRFDLPKHLPRKERCSTISSSPVDSSGLIRELRLCSERLMKEASSSFLDTSRSVSSTASTAERRPAFIHHCTRALDCPCSKQWRVAGV